MSVYCKNMELLSKNSMEKYGSITVKKWILVRIMFKIHLRNPEQCSVWVLC